MPVACASARPMPRVSTFGGERDEKPRLETLSIGSRRRPHGRDRRSRRRRPARPGPRGSPRRVPRAGAPSARGRPDPRKRRPAPPRGQIPTGRGGRDLRGRRRPSRPRPSGRPPGRTCPSRSWPRETAGSASTSRRAAACIPLRPDQDDTVLNALIARRPEIAGVGESGLRSGVVHRLDVGTTGAPALRHRRRELATTARRVQRASPGQALRSADRRPARGPAAGRPAAHHHATPTGPRRGPRRWPPDPTTRDTDRGLRRRDPRRGPTRDPASSIRSAPRWRTWDTRCSVTRTTGGPASELAVRPMLHAARLRFEEIVAEVPRPRRLRSDARGASRRTGLIGPRERRRGAVGTIFPPMPAAARVERLSTVT